MISWWLLLLLSVGYVALLFAIAYWGDSLDSRRYTAFARSAVYSLSLAVYCTSWTFYGAVGTATQNGWAFLPIYLGPMLVILFGWRMISRIVALSKRQNLTSIADFLAARYGKARSLAVLVTVIAIVGSVPYIALQLKAVASGVAIVSGGGGAVAGYDSALIIALFLAVFAILFGTRQIDASEHHHGMMLAIAFESVVKLLAFVAVGLFAFGLLGGSADSGSRTVADVFPLDRLPATFLTQTLLASAAIFCLPRQFHVAVVEAQEGADLGAARWQFPLYLLVICLFVVPITVAGLNVLPAGRFAGDTFVLALPMHGGQDWLTLLAYLGGFSAATGMVIVASVTLATMVSNEIVMPLLLRLRSLASGERNDVSRVLLLVRRVAILGIAAMAYAYFRVIESGAALASIGLLSFAAAAQFAPLIVLGLYWHGATRRGALAGLATGFTLWSYTLFLPGLARSGVMPGGFVDDGLFGLAWLRPEALLFDAGLAPLTHGVVWSLGANVLVLLTVSLTTRQSVAERIQARAFVDSGLGRNLAQPVLPAHEIANADLLALAGRFVGEDHAERAFRDFAERSGVEAAPSASADRGLIRFTERLLAGAIGAASARVVVATALRKTGMDIGDVVLLLDETSQAIRFNRRLLEATLENITQGVSVIDSSQRLIGWNSRYEELMEYPPGLLQIGKPIAGIIRYNESRGAGTDAAIEREIERRLALMRRGEAYRHESRAVGGKVVDIRGQAMPGGGYVTTYTDITEAKAAEAALRDSERQVRAYTDNAPALLAYVDAGRRFQFVNKAYVSFVGRPRDELIGRSIFEALDERQLRTRARYLDSAYGGERQSFELEMTNAAGESRFMLGTYIPDLSRGSQVVGVYAVFQDITERKQAELGLVEAKANLERRVAERTAALHTAVGELEAAKADAEAATASKTRFLAAAAHDLLQPLNATRLFTALLAEGTETMSDEQRRIVGRIETGLASVEDLLAALLDISRLDSHAPEPRPEPVAVADLFRTLHEQFAPSFAEQGLALTFAPTSLWVETDRALLRRILQNFISNARRYTPRGAVLVGGRRRGDSVALQVVDTGVGIAPEHQQAVFEEFRRLNGADRGAKRGLGLGLAIVERIARLLDHPVTMRSNPGRGSCFEIVVPRATAGAAAATDGIVVAAAGIDSLRGLDVLCVDNDPDILDGMAGLLGRWGMRALVARDPAAARAAIDAALAETGALPALLLLDYHLDDGVTGLDLAAMLHRDYGLDVPAVVVTADYTDDVAQRVESAGCTILRKPLKPAALRALLTRLVARRAVA